MIVYFLLGLLSGIVLGLIALVALALWFKGLNDGGKHDGDNY